MHRALRIRALPESAVVGITIESFPRTPDRALCDALQGMGDEPLDPLRNLVRAHAARRLQPLPSEFTLKGLELFHAISLAKCWSNRITFTGKWQPALAADNLNDSVLRDRTVRNDEFTRTATCPTASHEQRIRPIDRRCESNLRC